MLVILSAVIPAGRENVVEESENKEQISNNEYRILKNLYIAEF